MGLGKLTFLNKAKTAASAKVAQARKVLSDSKDDTRDKPETSSKLGAKDKFDELSEIYNEQETSESENIVNTIIQFLP